MMALQTQKNGYGLMLLYFDWDTPEFNLFQLKG